MPYIGTQPKDVRSFGRAQFDFTATQGQTDFTGADDDGKYLGYTEGQVQVYVNGILMDDADYNTSALGNAIYLTSAANLNDIITVVALQTDIPNSDYVPISGGTFSGDMNFSGDLTVGATAIHVDRTNNRLGVGTYSPSGVLSLKNGARTLDVKLEDSPPSGEYGVQFTAGSGDYLGFGAGGSGTAIAIDSSNRVTMPYQPAFDVGLTSGGVASTNVVLFNNVRLNQGSHYNTSTGRFTAPVNGLYEFYWGGIKNNTSSVTRVVLRKNGTDVRENRLAEGDIYNAACWIMLIELNASDYVDIRITAGSFYGQTDFYGNAFGGRLVG